MAKKKTKARCPKTGKVKFSTELDAEIFISRVQSWGSHHRKMKRGRDEPTRAYRCEFCHWWHVTGQTKGEGRGVA